MNVNFELWFKTALDYLANGGVQLSIILVGVNILLLVHLIVLQLSEIMKFKDYISKYRWILLVLFVISLLASIPVTYYLSERLQNINNDDLRNLSTVSARFAPLAITLGFEVMYYMISRGRKR